jgi:Domain of unknown function (DUF4263)
MAELITTRSVARGFAKVDDIELHTTPRTRILFRAGLHAGGVRGFIIRQRRGKDGTWKDANEVNFNSVPADCGVSIELDTEATSRLYEGLSQLRLLHQRGIDPGEQTYVVGTQNETIVVNDRNKAQAIQALLDRGHSEEYWQALIKSDPDLATRLAMAQVQFKRQQAIAEFETSLTRYADKEGYWQRFFEAQPWILQSAFSAPVFQLGGETYLGGKLPIGRQGKGGVATDFLFADDSTKSFAVVEIKTPHAKLVGPLYRGEDGTGLDNEVYSMHPELTGAVVQTRNQIAVAIEDFQMLERGGFYDKINRVHPKGVLVTGMVAALNQREKDSFNHFRQGLQSLTVITFDELLRRLKLLYIDESANADDEPWPDEPLDAFDTEESCSYDEDFPF